MAFIREYAAMSGDPGRRRGFFRRAFKPPRFVRKIASAALPFAASFIPGGNLAYQAAQLAGYAGDPGPKRGKAPKRKGAGSGPRAKAANKRKNRGHGKHSGGGGGIGAALGNLDYGALGQAAIGAIPVVGGVAAELAGQLRGGESPSAEGPIPGASTAITPTGDFQLVPHGVKHRMPTMVHRRVDSWMRRPGRSINPANVKALRRGVRRIEAFERIVKSVHKAYPRLARAAHHTPHVAHRRRK